MLLELGLSLLVFLFSRVLWRRLRYDLHKIPSPSALPWLGKGIELLSVSRRGGDQFVLRERWLQQAGNPRIMRVEFFGSTTLYVRDTECIQTVVLGKTNALPRTAAFGEVLLPLFGNDSTAKSMSTSENITPYTKAIRSVYASAMQTSQLEKAMPKMNTIMMRLVEVMEGKREEGPVDIQDLFVRLTMDVIGMMALGTNLGGLDNSGELYDKIQDASYVALDLYTDPLNSLYRRIFPESETARDQKNTIDRLVEEWKRLLNTAMEKEDFPKGEEPMLHRLKNTVDPETNAPLRDKELLREITTMMMAGMPTTGHQLAWIFAFLSVHEEVLHKLLDELREYQLLSPHPTGVPNKVSGELSYLNAVIKEGMRLGHVILESSGRAVTEDMTVMGYRVPKGTLLCAPGNRWVDPGEDWKDPDVFRPERWLTGEDMSQKHYFPFSHGARDCAGQNLAKLEMRLALIFLTPRYEFKLKKPLEELLRNTKTGISTQARDGIWMDVLPRPPPT